MLLTEDLVAHARWFLENVPWKVKKEGIMMATQAKVAVREDLSKTRELDTTLKEIAKLQTAIAELSERYDVLKEKAFPLVEVAGDMYEVDGIKAQIIRGQTWQVDTVKLISKFREKAYGLLTVSASKFRSAFESGMLGTKTELAGIAKLVDETPRFKLSQK